MSLIFSPQAVLTRLCGCDKLLQSLSVELAQLQMDKVGNSKDLILFRQYMTQVFNLKSHTHTHIEINLLQKGRVVVCCKNDSWQ